MSFCEEPVMGHLGEVETKPKDRDVVLAHQVPISLFGERSIFKNVRILEY